MKYSILKIRPKLQFLFHISHNALTFFTLLANKITLKDENCSKTKIFQEIAAQFI